MGTTFCEFSVVRTAGKPIKRIATNTRSRLSMRPDLQHKRPSDGICDDPYFLGRIQGVSGPLCRRSSDRNRGPCSRNVYEASQLLVPVAEAQPFGGTPPLPQWKRSCRETL